MNRVVVLFLLGMIFLSPSATEAASTKDKYIGNCVKFAQRINPQMRVDAALQKKACTCICEKVQEIGAEEDDLKQIMKYTREYNFTALPKKPTFQQILQAHVDVHKDIIATQSDLEFFVKGMMSCSNEAN